MLIRTGIAVLAWVLVAPAPSSAGQRTDTTDVTRIGEAHSTQEAAGQQDTRAKTGKAQKPKKSKQPKSDVPAPDEPSDPEAVDTGSRVRLDWAQHPRLQVGSVFRIEFEAKLQEDARTAYPLAKGLLCPAEVLPRTCTWEFHRNRLGVKGNLFKKIEYEVERELTEQELTERDLLLGYTPKPQWKDVNVNISYWKDAQIQVGKFKIPFGLDELTSVTHNDFIHRAMGTNTLAPARDIGAQVHGRFWKKGLNYWAGVFRRDGDNARSTKIQGGDQTFAARVTGSPFRRSAVAGLPNVEIGSAFAISKLSDASNFGTPNGFRGRSNLTQDVFYESVYVNGHRYRWEADADWTSGSFGARAEYTQVLDNRLGQGLGDQDLPNARARSWYVSGTWIVTGENKTRPVRPADDFLRHGFGAVELAARYERLWFDSVDGNPAEALRNPRAQTIYPEGARALTLGLNWTLNRFVKLQGNGMRERVEDPFYNPVPNTPAFWSGIFRVQLVL